MFAAVATLLLLAGLFVVPGSDATAAEIRFYKVNKKSQQDEIRLIRNRDEPGCHNLRRKREVYRAAQVGFTYCSVFEEKDCPDGKGIVMEWRGKVKKNSIRSQPSERLMPGDLWFFPEDQTRKLGSWLCVKN